MYKKLVTIYIGVSLLSYFLIGCAVKPEENVYLNPIMAGQEQVAGDNSAIITESGISVKVTALSTSDLLNVSSDTRINPYVDLTATNVAKPLYTVFNITVKDNSQSMVMIDPTLAVLIDADGNQHESITYETFKLRFPAIETQHYSSPYYPYRRDGNRWYYDYERYDDNGSNDKLIIKPISDDDSDNERGRVTQRDEKRNKGNKGHEGNREYYYYGNKYDHWDDLGDYYWNWDVERNLPRAYYRAQTPAYYKNAVAKKTLFPQINLYPGGAKTGFIAFPSVSTEEGKLKFIIPVTIYGRRRNETLHFQFDFQKTPASQSEKTK